MSLEKTALVVMALGAVTVSHCVWSASVERAKRELALDPGAVAGEETSEHLLAEERVPATDVEVVVTPSDDVDASAPRTEGRDPSLSQDSDGWPSSAHLALMADDLAERTIRLWSTEGFVDLTAEEINSLIPTPDGYAFVGPGSLQDLLGGLPSEEECSRAVQIPRIRMLLSEAARMDCVLADLEMIPLDRRPGNYSGIVEAFDLQRSMIEDDLMATLDRSTGYPHWSILNRLFREWEQ